TKMRESLPRLEIGDLALQGSFDSLRLAQFFEEAELRAQASAASSEPYMQIQPLKTKEKRSLFLRRYFPVLIAAVLTVYLGLAFLAPIMMKTGNTLTAQKIYNLFRPFCHQMASRSFFLFGSQLAYPTKLANVGGLVTYGVASGQPENNVLAASHFVGNERMGYKIALCQRDLAIYSSLLAVVLIFIGIRHKGKNIPWYLWVFLALLPVMLDGGTQLISVIRLPFLNWFPARESTPFLRVLTGTLFGGITAWYGLFTTDEIVEEDRLSLEKRSFAWKVSQK
ncbi:MAG TPA: DUF2085 domain-containing protein, partial [Anaerolineaceae bacterium]|nr:DUF2085 domain-containing protein [Anaerolineaceae bacterium]